MSLRTGTSAQSSSAKCLGQRRRREHAAEGSCRVGAAPAPPAAPRVLTPAAHAHLSLSVHNACCFPRAHACLHLLPSVYDACCSLCPPLPLSLSLCSHLLPAITLPLSVGPHLSSPPARTYYSPRAHTCSAPCARTRRCLCSLLPLSLSSCSHVLLLRAHPCRSLCPLACRSPHAHPCPSACAHIRCSACALTPVL